LNVLEQHVEARLGFPAGRFWRVRTTSADRVRNRIELILNFAAARGYRNGENSARWEDLKHILPQPAKLNIVKHHAAVPYADLPALFAQLRKREGVSARALEFLILTAARTGEVNGARWGEIDPSAKLWTVPGSRMKGGREHRVPLSDRAIEILHALPREDNNPFVFVGSKQGTSLSPTAMSVTLARMGPRGDDITVHGFRSTFRDWAAERTNFANHIVEQALAHAIGSKVEAAYRRTDLFDKRRKLMAAWATYCTTPPAKATAGKVVSLCEAR
jgi:integrase